MTFLHAEIPPHSSGDLVVEIVLGLWFLLIVLLAGIALAAHVRGWPDGLPAKMRRWLARRRDMRQAQADADECIFRTPRLDVITASTAMEHIRVFLAVCQSRQDPELADKVAWAYGATAQTLADLGIVCVSRLTIIVDGSVVTKRIGPIMLAPMKDHMGQIVGVVVYVCGATTSSVILPGSMPAPMYADALPRIGGPLIVVSTVEDLIACHSIGLAGIAVAPMMSRQTIYVLSRTRQMIYVVCELDTGLKMVRLLKGTDCLPGVAYVPLGQFDLAHHVRLAITSGAGEADIRYMVIGNLTDAARSARRGKAYHA